MLFSLGFWVGFGAGGALIWFGKATIQRMVIGTNALVVKMKADAAALEAKITPAAPAPAPAPTVTTKSS